jgi:hypothetical protein
MCCVDENQDCVVLGVCTSVLPLPVGADHHSAEKLVGSDHHSAEKVLILTLKLWKIKKL